MLWEVTDVDCDRFTIRLLDLLLGARKRKMLEKLNQTPPNQKSNKTKRKTKKYFSDICVMGKFTLLRGVSIF